MTLAAIWALLPTGLNYLILFGAALVAAAGIYKTIVKPFRTSVKKVNAGLDTLLGYKAVIDPGSGSTLKPETPPLAKRVEQVENAVIMLTDTHKRMTDFETRYFDLERRFAEHHGWSESWKGHTSKIVEVLDKRVEALENRSTE